MRTPWLLGGAGLLALVLAFTLGREGRTPGGPATDTTADSAPPSGFEAVEARVVDTDAAGRPQYRLYAEQVSQRDAEAPLQARQLRLEQTEDDHWTLSAERGELPSGSGHLKLRDGVRLRGQPAGTRHAVLVSTAALDYDLRRQRVTAPQGVTVDWGGQQLQARTLRGDLRSDQLELGGGVSARTAPPDIELEAADSQVDGATNRLTFTDVTITQGVFQIRARGARGEGAGLSFQDSRWEFTGDVRIRFEGGTLVADSAVIQFAGNRPAQARVSGTPAEFTQQVEGLPRPVQGRARSVTLDLLARTVRLTQDAWLFDGRNEIRSQAVFYDMRARLARAERGGSDDERVRITIRPEAP
jgi:LPS export ABC transporter protein LptC/lipopolysaccharide transport protein LptA